MVTIYGVNMSRFIIRDTESGELKDTTVKDKVVSLYNDWEFDNLNRAFEELTGGTFLDIWVDTNGQEHVGVFHDDRTHTKEEVLREILRVAILYFEEPVTLDDVARQTTTHSFTEWI